MAQSDPFGPDDEDFDRFTREVGDGLKDLVGRFLAGQAGQAAWSTFTDATTRAKARPDREDRPAEREVSADSDSGVWAVITATADGPRVEQVFPTELAALRANQHNTEADRRVRFLPYGIAVTALDGE